MNLDERPPEAVVRETDHREHAQEACGAQHPQRLRLRRREERR